MKDNCRNCVYHGFTTPEPPYGHGSNIWCKKHERRIRNTDGKCDQWVDRYKKEYFESGGRRGRLFEAKEGG